MKPIYEEYIDYINEHYDECGAAAHELMDHLRHSSVAYHGRCVYTLLVPKVFLRDEVSRFEYIVNTTYGIFEKVIREYLENPEYRKVFPFSDELQELILTDRGYKTLLPIARFDIFYNEDNGDFKFCEINTDGTSAMNEDYVLSGAYDINPAHRHVKQSHTLKSRELYDSWVKSFFDIYSSYKKKVDKPHVAIVDFLATGSITEFEEFQRRFEKAGHSCEVCDITELVYDGKKLYSKTGHAIDVIYRRAVTSDVIKRKDEVKAFLNAVKDENVCIIGAFCTQIIHNKWLFKALHEEPTQSLLTEEERDFVKKHVPYTNILSGDYCDIKSVIAGKDRWLIKPLDSYASKGVYAGCDCSAEEWEEHIRHCEGHDYIYQEYCPPYRTKNISFIDGTDGFNDYTNMSGLFVYNGRFAGVYSRLSTGGIISSQYNERAVPTFFEDI
ncbi:MAG TPA: glutathionylspermidine synthase family protein [Candidatus Alectryocaccobium stercorigallinarum]|nr:glutathionylspermidine synthase family protein [Candidatus Alectryocaccobium stercorigallinarum]